MWVLSPVVLTSTQVQDVRESLWYLARPGKIAVGRPVKQSKAKADSKHIDVLVFTDTSVSKRHATLEVVPPRFRHDSPKLMLTGEGSLHQTAHSILSLSAVTPPSPFPLAAAPLSWTTSSHPCLVLLADQSRFGTTVNNQRLDSGATVELQHQDVVVFGVSSRFRLECVHVSVCVTADADTGQLAEVAAAVGVVLLRAEPGASLPDEVSNPREGGGTGWLVVEDGAIATPLVALALLLGVPLVQTSWLHALLGEPHVWRDALPGAEGHGVTRLVLPEPAKQRQDGGSSGHMMELAGWTAPVDDLLSGYTLAMAEQVGSDVQNAEGIAPLT
jgi:hypothetical protein